MISLCAQRMPHQYICVIRWVYIATCRSMQQVYLQATPQLTRLTARVIAVRALSQVAGGAVLGEILEELEPVRALAGWPSIG
jgi:hypothetical protein